LISKFDQRSFAESRQVPLKLTSQRLALKDAGVPDSVVQALVGHESAAMSHRYTHVGKESLARATSALPEI
jgi:integrase